MINETPWIYTWLVEITHRTTIFAISIFLIIIIFDYLAKYGVLSLSRTIFIIYESIQLSWYGQIAQIR